MKKIILSAIVFVGAMTLNAQDEAPKLSVSGTVDAYYQTYLISSDDVRFFWNFICDEAGFALGMANVVLSYEGEKTGCVADLVFGPRGRRCMSWTGTTLTNYMLTGMLVNQQH